MTTQVYFVRHAQPDYMWEDDRTRPLTDEGRQDSKMVLEFLRDKEIDVFYCSPYKRSFDTIADTAAFCGREIITDERLREREKGIGGNTHEMFEKRWADHDYHEDDGESINMVQKRNIAALKEILAENRGKKIVIGTHGTALSTILNYYYPEFGCKDYLRIIDWMPYIIELDFDGDELVEVREHCYAEKEYLGKKEVREDRAHGIAGMRIVNLVENTPGVPGCGYEHGLSFYIETKKHRLLVDSGATDLFLHNAGILGIDPALVDIMVLSHGHYDHAGGIPAFSKVNPDARIYLKASAGKDYYHLKKSGEEKYIGIDKEILRLKQCVFVQGDLEIDDELFLYTDLPGERYPVKGNLELKEKAEGGFIQDTFDHEQCLVITQEGRRILLSGCAHSGILNILDRYREIFHSEPDMVLSGFHLMKEGEYSPEEIQNIRNIARELSEMNTVFYTGHCTGGEAFNIMKEIMGEKLQIIHSGMTIL